MSCDIFGLRIVIIKGFCWNWNVLMVMELLVKIYVNELWYIWIKNCDNTGMLKLECIDGYGVVGKNICEWVMIYLDWELWW
jgi:hypothetical protein